MVGRCSYEYKNGTKCGRPVFVDSSCSGNTECALHMRLEMASSMPYFTKLINAKHTMLRLQIAAGDFFLEGIIVTEKIDLSNRKIDTDLVLSDARIESLSLAGAEIFGSVFLDSIKLGLVYAPTSHIHGDFILDYAELESGLRAESVEIDGSVNASNSLLNGHFWINDSNIRGNLLIVNATINGYLSVSHSKIAGAFSANESTIKGDVQAIGSSIQGSVLFYGSQVHANLNFRNAYMGGEINLSYIDVEGGLVFKGAKFALPVSQERACRRAKAACEQRGARDVADHYFYCEMAAKRRQKGLIPRVLELVFVQWLFKYGTSWARVLITWIAAVLAFSFIYWAFNGLDGSQTVWSSLYFSIVTATTLGYGDLVPRAGVMRGIASAEAMFGAFMWAAFVVVFARRYMR